MSEIGNTTAGVIRKALHDIEDDTPISFEFIVASFFPGAFENMKSLLKDTYTQGYIQAKEEVK